MCKFLVFTVAITYVFGTRFWRFKWKNGDVCYVSTNMILNWVVVALFQQELSFMTSLRIGFVQHAEQGKMILEKWNLFRKLF